MQICRFKYVVNELLHILYKYLNYYQPSINITGWSW